MITREKWLRLRPILEPALELTDEELPAYLDHACGADADLRATAELLLTAARQASRALDFLDSPAAELAAPLLELERLSSDPGELQPDVVVGAYTVERRLGSGGSGIVYLAHDRRLNRKVALKLLPSWLAAREASNRRFLQEAQAASGLDHPNIETVYEVGETTDGRFYIAMAYYDGETLQDRIAHGALGVGEAIGLARQIADGLTAAHAGKILHRDIKPSNVIVTREGVAKIVDFGAAKIASDRLTVTGVAHGTVAYMSPEQTMAAVVDARTDIWSLGVVLYEMLAGTRPFRGDSPDAVIFAIRNDEPEPLPRLRPDIPVALARLVHRCLAKDPHDRYQTAHELRRDLDLLPDGYGWTLWRRTRAPRALATAAVGLVVISGLVLAWNLYRPGAPSQPAAAIAVLPAVPAVAVSNDSMLARTGHLLAVTLSANLDGMGEIRTLPARSVLARAGEQAISLEQSARLARRLGATSFLYSTMLQIGAGLRLDLELLTVGSRTRIAQASVTAPADDLGALTDAATIELLRDLWNRGQSPVPNVAAITTRSIPALRAYVEGELAFARSDFDDAVRAFERAQAADSTFTLPYWKSLYAREYEGSEPDTFIVAAIIAHRDSFPDSERMMMEAYAAPTLSEKLQILQRATQRFREYWPAWYAYADRLVHDGPYLGRTYADALDALERVIELNPRFAMGWVHMIWIAALQRDTLTVNRIVEQLRALSSKETWVVHPDNMNYAYAVQELLRSGGKFTGDLPDTLARVVLGPVARAAPENLALRFLLYGFPIGQLQQIDAVLRARAGLNRPTAAAQWLGKAFVWASRGAWDSAFVATQQWLRYDDSPQAALRAYGLAVLGVSTGAVSPETASRSRPRALPSAANRAEWLVERAWLDGVVAYFRQDPGAIARAQEELGKSDAQHAELAQHHGLLVNSLQAFQLHATGSRDAAADSLAALESAAAEYGLHSAAARFHPYLAAIHRPAAARWHLESGDTIEALHFLRWHEAILTASRSAPSRVVDPLALYERARIEEAWGRRDETGARDWRNSAQKHFRVFIDRYDRPPPAHQELVANAHAGLKRVSRTSAR